MPTITGNPANNLSRGVTAMLLAMLLLPLLDVVAKHLTATMSSGQIVWGRMFFQSLLLLPMVWPLRRHLSVDQWHLFAIRGILIVAATVFFFSSLSKMPIADALAIFFVEPLILTLLSALFLREPIGVRRITAVLIGFIGALIIIQPSAKSFGVYAVLPLGAALCFAGYLTITRKLAQVSHVIVIQLYTGVAGCVAISIAMLVGNAIGIGFLEITTPTHTEWGFMGLLGVIGCIGHLLVVYAFRFIDASVLAPFQYFEIIGAVVFGWYFFSDIPAFTTWLGIVIIIASGFYIYLREQQIHAITEPPD